MLSWFNNIDALLRGDLRKDGQGAEGQIDFPVVRVVLLSIFLASIETYTPGDAESELVLLVAEKLNT